jgi:hypothetical protein
MTNQNTAATVVVLAKDSDPDVDTLTVTVASAPSHGTFKIQVFTGRESKLTRPTVPWEEEPSRFTEETARPVARAISRFG